MPCYHPIQAWRKRGGVRKNGKWPLTFDMASADLRQDIKIPCGKCIGCRLERSRQWAIRCVHESTMYDNNCFITLTYDDNHLDKNGSLNKRDFVLFMKKLRKKFGEGIRFFHCGEYGEKFQRPHHHACLFNHDFNDKQLWSVRNGINIYTSEDLYKLWPYGYNTIGEVNFESAAYVARYITKKITGNDAKEHYKGRMPEYITMSRRPGIGKGWYDLYKDDVYNTDKCVVRPGFVARPPRYYDKLYDIDNKWKMFNIKCDREEEAKLLPKEEFTKERLIVKEECKKIQITNLKRGYECS
jgi:hypothetical protein